jgi:HlyD family secretion protein
MAAVTRGPLRVTIDEDGRTRVKERYVVSSPLSGRLGRVTLKAGDSVEAGKTVLCAIEPGEPEPLDVRSRAQAEARIKAAEAGREQAVANLDRARAADGLAVHEAERVKGLVNTAAVSRQDFDTAEHRATIAREEMRAAGFALKIADFELEQARAALLHAQSSEGAEGGAHFEIRSPVNGRVLRVLQESATVVAPGMKLVELGDTADLEIEIDVLSTDAVRIRPGARVLIEHWGGDVPLEARVRLVEPAAFTKVSALGVEEQRVWVIADFTDPADGRRTIGDAFRIEARIVVDESDSALQVPAGAVFRQGEGWAAFAARDGRAALRPLRIGRRNDAAIEVLDGLTEGDTVILHPSDKIADGVRIRARK